MKISQSSLGILCVSCWATDKSPICGISLGNVVLIHFDPEKNGKNSEIPVIVLQIFDIIGFL
jgi:hypothetical protein